MLGHAGRLFFACLVALTQPMAGLDQDLSNQLVEIDLDNAVLRVVLDRQARPHLSVRVIAREGTQDLAADGPTVTVREEGEELRLRRAADSPTDQRLLLDLTLKLDQPLVILGKELDVSVKGPALDLEEMAAMRELARDAGGAMPAPRWTEVTLDLESSQAEVFGLSGALLRGHDTWFTSRQSTNELQIELVGGAVELEQHRGKLLFVGGGEGSEVTLHDVMGSIEIEAKGGKLELNSSSGKIDGTLADTEARFFDWNGHAELSSTGGALEMRGFRPSDQRVSLVASGTQVAIEGMERGSLDLEQKGGKLVLRDVTGKMQVEAGFEAEVELERLGGDWKILLTDSELTAEEVERMVIEVYNGKLKAEGVEGLELVAHGSDIVAWRSWPTPSATMSEPWATSSSPSTPSAFSLPL